MRRVIVNEWMTFDGVVQSAGADDDRSGGFDHGGWHLPYMDEVAQEWVAEGYADAGGFLLGRRTYELLAGYWPTAPEEEQAVALPLNELPKYVASTTLSEPLEWANAFLLRGDVASAVRSLKQADSGDLHVIGSTQLVHTLLGHDLIDGYRLMIDPLVLGGGKRVFHNDGKRRPMRLVDSRVATTGAILATYSSVSPETSA